MHDLIVVGAGPVGSYLASLCSSGMKVMVLEEHPEAGNKACSGLVSGRLKSILPANVARTPGLFQHAVKAALIHFMGSELEVRKKTAAAYVIDRDLLDKNLAEHAESMGCEVRFGERVGKISVLKDRVSVRTGGNAFESKAVAGCDGANSITARCIGARPAEILNGLILYEDAEDRSDRVEMWFDRKLVKDGFLWRIPRGSQTEYGGMGSNLSFPILDKFFGTGKKRIAGRRASPIPVGIVKTYADRVLLAGDSACQTKPWSGGGITYGLLSAKAASDVISRAVEKDDFSARLFSEYETLWKKLLIRDIQAGLVFRDMYREMKEDDMAEMLKNMESLKGMADMIDFDFPFTGILGDLIGA